MEENKFYYKDWFLWISLFIFAPLGIFLLWKRNKFSSIPRAALSFVFGLFFFTVISYTVNRNMIAQNNKPGSNYEQLGYKYPSNYININNWLKKIFGIKLIPQNTPKPILPTPKLATPTPTPLLTPSPLLTTPKATELPLQQITPAPVITIPPIEAATPSSTPAVTIPPLQPTPAVPQPTSVALNQDISIIIDGKAEKIGTIDTVFVNGVETSTVKIDEKLLREKLTNANYGTEVIISVPGNNIASSSFLSGDIIKEMEKKGLTFILSTPNINYALQAKNIKIDDISSKIGKALSDIEVNIKITKASESKIYLLENTASKGKFIVMSPPVEFNINAGSGGNIIEVKEFNSYVSKQIRIPDEVGADKITTAVIENPDGSVRHVPTYVTVIDGKYYAKVNSLTNSTYALIWNPKEFSDVASHWAKAQINEMYSRKIISGISENTFDANRDITRAEFATIVVKALGLEPKGSDSFKDVNAANWFYDYVGTANNYGIVLGIGEGTFQPLRSITREEAMAMVHRAAKIAGMNVTVTDAQISALTKFSDHWKFSSWAQGVAAFNVSENFIQGANGFARPQDKITRAETAVIVMRMLQKSGLIDARVMA